MGTSGRLWMICGRQGVYPEHGMRRERTGMTLISTRNADAIELLALNEDTIGRLYEAYAERFPEAIEFWQGLARQEQAHAALIRRFGRETDASAVFKAERFRSAAIRLSTRHTEGEIAAARAPGLKTINALSIANAIEQSLIESRFFEVFETDSAELKTLFQKLMEDSRDHARVVLARLNAYRSLPR